MKTLRKNQKEMNEHVSKYNRGTGQRSGIKALKKEWLFLPQRKSIKLMGKT